MTFLQGAWIAGAGANREFNNQYYTIMLDGDWAQRYIFFYGMALKLINILQKL